MLYVNVFVSTWSYTFQPAYILSASVVVRV